jgi:hypothetical protein
MSSPAEYIQEKINLQEVLNGLTPLKGMNTLYDELMQKESKVLDVINRMAENENKAKNTAFLDTPLRLLFVRTLQEWNAILAELAGNKNVKKTFRDYLTIFKKENRTIYIGFLLVIIALFLLLISN